MNNIPKNSQTITLANKLAKQTRTRIIKPTATGRKSNQAGNLEDIEDLAPERYFSPLQTRKQRHNAAQDLAKPSAPPIKKSRVSKIKLGSATVVTCEIVPKTETQQEVKLEGESPNPLWYRHLENIRLMRNAQPAPVDTMGCHQCADKNADEKTQRFHKLVALMLSSQTKDETTFEAMKRLKARTLTPDSVKDMPVSELEGLLHPVSFYKNKAKYVKQTSQILLDKYQGDIPPNVKELIALPGVGPKMAHICMAVAWQQITGIGVDVHVHRISNRLGWLKSTTKEPEQTRLGLESWLPKSLWSEVNHLFVGFGQTICMPVKPNCKECLNREICPAAGNHKKTT